VTVQRPSNARPQPSTDKALRDDDRDLFAAYVLDDASREAALELAQVRGWPTSDVMRGDVSAAMRMLAVGPPPRFMVVDVGHLNLDEIEEAVTEISRSGSTMIVLGDRNDVAIYRRLRDAGASDYLYKPVDGGLLNAAFARLETPSGEVGLRARKAVFVGARGGIGTSTLVANSAWLMTETLRRRVFLVDPDVHFGTMALQFDVAPNRGLRDGLQSPDRIDAIFLHQASTPVNKNLRLLASEELLDGGGLTSTTGLESFLEAAARECDVVMMDLPRQSLSMTPELLSKFDVAVVVMDASLAGLRDGVRLVRHLRLKHGTIKAHVVVVQRDPRPEIKPGEIEKALETKVTLWIPYARELLKRCEMEGAVFAKAHPTHAIAKGIMRLNTSIAGILEPPKRSRWRSWRRPAEAQA
jgi:pilus assembly protein CpaE